jgi:hypothetical protein
MLEGKDVPKSWVQSVPAALMSCIFPKQEIQKENIWFEKDSPVFLSQNENKQQTNLQDVTS